MTRSPRPSRRLAPQPSRGHLPRLAGARWAGGFTLLEVLAAIALLAIVFAIGLSALGGAARNASRAVALDAALEHAQSLLAAQGLGAPLASGTHTGRFADGMTWSLKVQALPRPARNADDATEAVDFAQTGGVMMAQAAAIDLYQLDVAIEYGDHRTLRLSTQRAQAAQAAPP